jgi:hypothetical protein
VPAWPWPSARPFIPTCPTVHARATFAGFNAGHSLTSILHGASAASLTRVVVFDLNYHMYLFVLVALRIAIVACCLPILPVASCIVVFDPDLSHPACSVQQAVRVHMYRSPCSIVVSANRIRSDPIRSDPIRSDPIRSDPIAGTHRTAYSSCGSSTPR